LLKFFDLSSISRETGVNLPLDSLIKAPNIKLMAKLLEQSDANWSALVALQTNGRNPPLFFIPSTTVLPLIGLCQFLGKDQPLYALQPYQADGQPIHKNAIALAKTYVQEIIKVQNNGPYFLAGDCLGGIIAFQVAAELEKLGQIVQFLALADPPVPGLDMPKVVPKEMWAMHLESLNIFRHGPKHVWEYISRKISVRMQKLSKKVYTHKNPSSNKEENSYARPSDIYYQAFLTYQPESYHGKAIMFQPNSLNFSIERLYKYQYEQSYESMWSQLICGGISRVETMADHGEIWEGKYLQDFGQKLASNLKQINQKT